MILNILETIEKQAKPSRTSELDLNIKLKMFKYLST